jgi:SAM-dependent methyltransferase
MDRPSWAPPDVDIDTPNPARMYNYLLGGSHNFAADRRLADQIATTMPDSVRIAHANRAFVGRAVTWLIDSGIRQFLDIGSGIPTTGNVHEIALRAAPDARVVYVDRDPVAVAHSRAILADRPSVHVVQADLRQPRRILTQAAEVLAFDEPVAVLLCAVLHFLPDVDGPASIVGALMDATVPGSFLVISHGSRDRGRGDEEEITAAYRQTTSPLTLRTSDEIAALFDQVTLLPPGVVPAPLWRPDDESDPEDLPILVGAGNRR